MLARRSSRPGIYEWDVAEGVAGGAGRVGYLVVSPVTGAAMGGLVHSTDEAVAKLVPTPETHYVVVRFRAA